MVILEKRTLDIKGPRSRDQLEVLGDDLDGLQRSEKGDRGAELEKKLDETNCQVRKSEQLKGKFEVSNLE